MKCLEQTGTANEFTFLLQEMSDLLPHTRSFLVKKVSESLKNQVGKNSEGKKVAFLQGHALGTGEPPGPGITTQPAAGTALQAAPHLLQLPLGKGSNHSRAELTEKTKGRSLLSHPSWPPRPLSPQVCANGTQRGCRVAAPRRQAPELHLPRDASPTTSLGLLREETVKVKC